MKFKIFIQSGCKDIWIKKNWVFAKNQFFWKAVPDFFPRRYKENLEYWEFLIKVLLWKTYRSIKPSIIYKIREYTKSFQNKNKNWQSWKEKYICYWIKWNERFLYKRLENWRICKGYEIPGKISCQLNIPVTSFYWFKILKLANSVFFLKFLHVCSEFQKKRIYSFSCCTIVSCLT